MPVPTAQGADRTTTQGLDPPGQRPAQGVVNISPACLDTLEWQIARRDAEPASALVWMGQ